MAQRDIRNLDIGMLRAFDALLRERSVSRAATRLFLSQPAMSASLRRLRETFADTLFTRTAHGVEPTARALALADQVGAILAGLNQLLDGEQGFAPGTSERIFRISGSDQSSAWLLPQLASELAAAGSKLRIAWEPAGFTSLHERLKKGDTDLAIMPGRSAPRELESVSLYADRFVYAARAGHPSFAAAVPLDVFCTIPQGFFGYGESGFDSRMDELLDTLNRKRFVQIALPSFHQVVDLLERSDFAAVLPQRVARRFAGRLALQELPFEMPGYESFLCWHKRSNQDAGVQWLKEQLLRVERTAEP